MPTILVVKESDVGRHIGEWMARGFVQGAFVDTHWGYVVVGLSLLGVAKEVYVARRAIRRRAGRLSRGSRRGAGGRP